LLVLFYFDQLFGPNFLLFKAHHRSLFSTAINFSHLCQPPPTPAQASIGNCYDLQQEKKKKKTKKEKKKKSLKFHKFSAFV
jgi:hypothetical protein